MFGGKFPLDMGNDAWRAYEHIKNRGSGGAILGGLGGRS